MNKSVHFSREAFYFVEASSNASNYPVPNGLASIYHQSEMAIRVPEKDREVLDRRPFASAETAFEVLVNRLRKLYMGAVPVIYNLPEPLGEKEKLDEWKDICNQIE